MAQEIHHDLHKFPSDQQRAGGAIALVQQAAPAGAAIRFHARTDRSQTQSWIRLGTNDNGNVLTIVHNPKVRVSRCRNQLLPGLPSEGHPSMPQAQSLPGPVALAGKWSGQILTYKRPVNVTLDIRGDGSAQGWIGDGPSSTATNVSLKPRHFYGQFPGEASLPDSPSRPFTIELDVALNGDKLIGAATLGLCRKRAGISFHTSSTSRGKL